jgi:hypothetical protein
MLFNMAALIRGGPSLEIVPMSQPAKTLRRKSQQVWQEKFVAMLPAIQEHAVYRFRHRPPEEREDLVAEVVALACLMFARLVERGKVGYATPLAVYACRQVAVGRRLGSSLNVNDVTSTYCQRRKRVFVQPLNRYDTKDAEWREIVVEDRTSTPADIAATKIDFSDWLDTLPKRQRRIAETLATGETTGRTARLFRVSEGRISQIRRKLFDAWREFQGEVVGSSAVATA